MISFKVLKLKISNFVKWSIKIKALLIAYDVWKIVEKVFTPLKNEASLIIAQRKV